MKGKVLVIGGAGYIGSHVCKELRENGYKVVVYDNFSTGNLDAVFDEYIKADIKHIDTLKSVLYDFKIDSVMHFAAQISLPESVEKPFFYYQKNLVETLNMLEACDDVGIDKIIFSSTAAVYGDELPFENSTPNPKNPYGRSKYFIEKIFEDLKFKTVSLRYFNVAGADPGLEIGSYKRNVKDLINICCECALGRRDEIKIYGDDYDTPDGTGVRDYIHVTDLANAHLKALEFLKNNTGNHVFNVGYNKGFSVKEVIKATEEVAGKKLKVTVENRRKGDLASVVAENLRIKKSLKWNPKYDNLKIIIKNHYEWLKKIENRLY